MLDHSWERSLGYCLYEERDWFTLEAKIAQQRGVLEARRLELGPLDFEERAEIDHQLHRLTTRKLITDLIASRDAVRQKARDARLKSIGVISEPAREPCSPSPALASGMALAPRFD